MAKPAVVEKYGFFGDPSYVTIGDPYAPLNPASMSLLLCPVSVMKRLLFFSACFFGVFCPELVIS
jgi:hypothetical protein